MILIIYHIHTAPPSINPFGSRPIGVIYIEYNASGSQMDKPGRGSRRTGECPSCLTAQGFLHARCSSVQVQGPFAAAQPPWLPSFRTRARRGLCPFTFEEGSVLLSLGYNRQIGGQMGRGPLGNRVVCSSGFLSR